MFTLSILAVMIIKRVKTHIKENILSLNLNGLRQTEKTRTHIAIDLIIIHSTVNGEQNTMHYVVIESLKQATNNIIVKAITGCYALGKFSDSRVAPAPIPSTVHVRVLCALCTSVEWFIKSNSNRLGHQSKCMLSEYTCCISYFPFMLIAWKERIWTSNDLERKQIK